ncbi:LCP family protein [Corynebacterium gallinarum]|uniref:LCP family protein n=1 Tax=Corynebacterium gallinarum TaxID=2762214 RepID=A0A8I0HG23_9CORY|nr:LCP family protein [Corynebacterium gallinarum]MBD8031151.1 LCP family protein [Corynebacterium gallinarum]
MDSRGQGDFARDSQGRPILDRYGRPVRARRQATQRPTPPRRTSPPADSTRIFPEQPGSAAPRQQFPPAAPRQQFPPQQFPPRPQNQPGPQVYQHPGHVGHVPQELPQVVNTQGPAQRRRRGLPRIRLRPRGCLGSLFTMFAVILVLVGAVTLWADSQLNRVDATPEARVSNTAGTNWLLVGSDSRQGLSEEDINRLGTGGDIGVGRTDTIMVLHLPRSGEPTLLSIPRDSYVNIPGWGMDKINAAFTVGGPELLAQTVEESTGLRVDHYAEIGMGGLANMVDAIGGVEMCPADPIQDPLANLDIQAGCQEFDGATALGYVRTRATAMGDLDRVVRQREFFSALLSTATSPGTLLNPFRVFPMIGDAVGTFTVGEGDHVWHLGRLALAMRGGIQNETVPIATFADYDVGNVVIWDDYAAEELFSSLR